MAHLSKKRKERITEEKLCSRESTPSSAENLHLGQALAASDWPDGTACVPIGYLRMGCRCRCGPPFFPAFSQRTVHLLRRYALDHPL